MKEKIETNIKSQLSDAEVHVFSHDGVHFEAVVVSAQFVGKPLVQQHRVVMQALKEDFDSEVLHALRLQTFTPEKWESAKSQYPIS